jgi:hypothetical protein
MFGTFLYQSGIRCCVRANANEVDNDSEIMWCQEERTKEVDSKKKKETIEVPYRPLPPIVFTKGATLDQCIEQVILDSEYPSAACLTKNEQGNWALMSVGEKRIFIAESIITDKSDLAQ